MKIVIISSRFPFPLDEGDKLRLFNQIKYLSVYNDIYLIALNTDSKVSKLNYNNVKSYCKELHVINISHAIIAINLLKSFIYQKPLQVGFFYSKCAHKQIKSIINKIKPDWVYSQLIRTAEYTKEYDNNIIDYMDALSKGLERRIQNCSFVLKPIIKREYKLTKDYENKIFSHFKKHTIITKNDRNFISNPNKKEIKIIPNGVDMNYFKPKKITKKYDVIFVGNMSYPPNIEAAEFLCQKVLPIIQNKYKIINVIISGVNPHSRVKRLANDNIKISGWVEDIRDVYASGKVFIAPMFIGSGLQNKLLEAMSMGIPCITTSLANNALMANNDEIIIANNQEEFANSCIKVLTNQNIASSLSKKGLLFIQKNYNWKKINKDLNIMFNK